MRLTTTFLVGVLALGLGAPAASPELTEFEKELASGRLLLAEEKLLPLVERPEACEERQALTKFYAANPNVQPKDGLLEQIAMQQVANGCEDPAAFDLMKRKLRGEASTAPTNEARLASYARYVCMGDSRAFRALDGTPDPADENRAWAMVLSKAIDSASAPALQLTKPRLAKAVRHVETADNWEPWLRATEILKAAAAEENPFEYHYELAAYFSTEAKSGSELKRLIAEVEKLAPDERALVLLEKAEGKPLVPYKILNETYAQETLVRRMRANPAYIKVLDRIAADLARPGADGLLKGLESAGTPEGINDPEVLAAVQRMTAATQAAKATRDLAYSIRKPAQCADRADLERERGKAIEALKVCKGEWGAIVEERKAALEAAIAADQEQKNRVAQELALAQAKEAQLKADQQVEAEKHRKHQEELLDQLNNIQKHIEVIGMVKNSTKTETELTVQFNNTAMIDVDGFKGTLTVYDQFNDRICDLPVEGDRIPAGATNTITYILEPEVHKKVSGRVNLKHKWTCTRCVVQGVVH